MTRLQEIETKLERVRDFMSTRGLDAVVLTKTINFQWLTAGADNHVVIDTDAGAVPVVITANSQHVITNNIEAVRLEDEEIGELPFEIDFMNWHDENPEAMLAQIVEGRIASDGCWSPKLSATASWDG